ncbi:MAG: hypothetical protein RLY95_745, partial [Pseudomonadota bacterium]
MNTLLNLASNSIRIFLQEKLPLLTPRWWQESVVDRLTFQQQRWAVNNRIDTLGELDLAALLRVLDQNWSELAGLEPLPRDARSWVKELQGARNRWAHAPSTGLNPKDTYRDADTLGRLLEIIRADQKLLDMVEQFKTETASKIATSFPPLPPSPSPVILSSPTYKFSVGQLVCLRSNLSTVFPVLEIVTAGGAEVRYRVFENGGRQVYYESQLQTIDELETTHRVLNATELSAMLTAVQLSSPSASAL